MPDHLHTETYRFLLSPTVVAVVTFEGGPVTARDLAMLQRYLAMAEMALADAPAEDER